MRTAGRRLPSHRRPRVEPLEARALLSTAAGALDPSFGGGSGYSTVPYLINTPLQGSTRSVVVESNGKIVVAGTYQPSREQSLGTVERLNADGTPDATFGLGGRVQFPVSSTAKVSTIVQADGKIVEALGSTDGGGNPTYLAIRFNLDGSLDTTFGAGGFASYPASTPTPVTNRIGAGGRAIFATLQPDGKIVLAGSAEPGTSLVFAAVRLNTDGSLDTTYGQIGTSNVAVTINGLTTDHLEASAVQADGKVLLVGDATSGSVAGGRFGITTSDAVVVRLTTDGSLDTTYGGASAGQVIIPPDLANPSTLAINVATAAAVGPSDGKLLVAGFRALPANEPDSNTLYRLNADGTLDTTLGANGLANPAFDDSVAAQRDGKILLAGTNPSIPSGVVRLNPDGSVDATFGNTVAPGVSRGYPGYISALPQVVAVRPSDGKILLAGVGTVPSLAGRLGGFTVARFLPGAGTGPAAKASPLPPASYFFFDRLDGNLQTSLALYDPSTASFSFSPPATNLFDGPIPFGGPGVGNVIPAVANYEGNTGPDQLAAYLPQVGIYAVRPSIGPDKYYPFGTPGPGQTIPVPADYDGDGKADVAIYLAASGSFAILPSDGSPGRTIQFGTPGPGRSIPAPADYFGTGHDDLGVYLADLGGFAVTDPAGQVPAVFVPFGSPGVGVTIPVPGDYDGSGHVELAVYLPSLGEFIYRPYNGGGDVTVPFGIPNVGELPVPGDYDGSGRAEFAVYDPIIGFIAYRPASGGPDVSTPFGTPNNGSIPVATPAGALPEFQARGPGPGVNALSIRAGLAGPGAPAPVATPTAGVAPAPAVPPGPRWPTPRVARALINQGGTEPGDRDS